VADGQNWIVRHKGPLRPEKPERRAAPVAQDHRPGDLVDEDGQVINNNVAGGLIHTQAAGPIDHIHPEQLRQVGICSPLTAADIRNLVYDLVHDLVHDLVYDIGTAIRQLLPTILVIFAILIAVNPDKVNQFLHAAWDMATWPFSQVMDWYRPKLAGILGNLRRIFF
jgi:hypothetical protein